MLGPTGAGTTEHFGIDSPRIIHMGTLSKAYGCIGGFVATEPHIVEILRFGCSAFGFTSTLPPDQAAAVLEAIDMVATSRSVASACGTTSATSFDECAVRASHCLSTQTPIVPLHVGDEGRVHAHRRALREAGIPRRRDHVSRRSAPGQSRLRFIMNAQHTTGQIDRVIDALGRTAMS